LDYPAFRPCPAGKQVYISYGPVPNLKLISYYGFSIRNNPHDVVPLTLELPDLESTQATKRVMQRLGVGLDHNLRHGELAKPLLACLRLIVATQDELSWVESGSKNPLEHPLSQENEVQALETLTQALKTLLETVEEALVRVDRVEQEQVNPHGGAHCQSRDAEVAIVKAEALNENGLDAGWKASMTFCRVYLEGQYVILQHAVDECARRRSAVTR
jgi:hypothetical protein